MALWARLWEVARVLLAQDVLTETGWLEWVWRTVITAAIATMGGVLTQYIVPRMRRLKERADTAQVIATTAKTKAEASTAQFVFYETQLDYLKDRVSDLETSLNLMRSQQYRFRAHIDDLYSSIGQEPPEVQTRLKGRLKTQRPNGDKPHIEKEGG